MLSKRVTGYPAIWLWRFLWHLRRSSRFFYAENAARASKSDPKVAKVTSKGDSKWWKWIPKWCTIWKKASRTKSKNDCNSVPPKKTTPTKTTTSSTVRLKKIQARRTARSDWIICDSFPSHLCLQGRGRKGLLSESASLAKNNVQLEALKLRPWLPNDAKHNESMTMGEWLEPKRLRMQWV